MRVTECCKCRTVIEFVVSCNTQEMSLAPHRQTTNLRSLVSRTAWQLDDIAYSGVSVYDDINQRIVHLLQLRRCTRMRITSIDATFTKPSSDDRREHRLGHVTLIMIVLWNRADHYIFILCCFFLSSSFFFFFPRLISAVAYWMSTVLLDMVWP